MSRATTTGIVLGVVAFTDREESLHVGPIDATPEPEEVGGVLLAAGVLLVAVGSTHRG